MKLSQVLSLTPDELRVVVAKLVGWKKIESESSTWNNAWTFNGMRSPVPPPLYAVRLDATIDVIEQTDTVGFVDDYVGWLSELVLGVKQYEFSAADAYRLTQATAIQRARAYVLAMA